MISSTQRAHFAYVFSILCLGVMLTACGDENGYSNGGNSMQVTRDGRDLIGGQGGFSVCQGSNSQAQQSNQTNQNGQNWYPNTQGYNGIVRIEYSGGAGNYPQNPIPQNYNQYNQGAPTQGNWNGNAFRSGGLASGGTYYSNNNPNSAYNPQQNMGANQPYNGATQPNYGYQNQNYGYQNQSGYGNGSTTRVSITIARYNENGAQNSTDYGMHLGSIQIISSQGAMDTSSCDLSEFNESGAVISGTVTCTSGLQVRFACHRT